MGDIGVVEVRLSDGAPLLIRAERIDGAPKGPADVSFRESLTFSNVTAAVRGIAGELHQALQAVRPDFVSVELGFDLAISSSHLLALVADAGARSSIQVRLEWRKESWSADEAGVREGTDEPILDAGKPEPDGGGADRS